MWLEKSLRTGVQKCMQPEEIALERKTHSVGLGHELVCIITVVVIDYM